MFVKGLVITGLFASAPIALVSMQGPGSAAPVRVSAPLQSTGEMQQHRQAQQDMARMRQELDAARADLQRLRQQLERALIALDRAVEPQQQRERNCSPSRSRALLSHYQWLRDEGHQERAAGALARVVEQVGNDPHQRNQYAQSLMTEKEMAGKCDDVALAIVQKMVEAGAKDASHLDTAALAHFLNGQVARAVELQQRAVEAGGRHDEFRRRLLVYQAAQAQMASGRGTAPTSGETLVAAGGGGQ